MVSSEPHEFTRAEQVALATAGVNPQTTNRFPQIRNIRWAWLLVIGAFINAVAGAFLLGHLVEAALTSVLSQTPDWGAIIWLVCLILFGGTIGTGLLVAIALIQYRRLRWVSLPVVAITPIIIELIDLPIRVIRAIETVYPNLF